MPALGLGLGLALSSGIRRLDPDAAAYIAAVRAAGGTVTATQSAAINTFVVAGKAQNWWAQVKRLYLPIWGVAAPNALDMVTRASGTFVGAVTHGAGFVQGDGTTGYLNTNTDFVTQGLSASTGLMFALTTLDATADFDRYLGAGNGADEASLASRSIPRIDARFCGIGAGQVSLNTSSNTGVVVFSRLSGVRRLSLRKTSGVTQTSATNADNGTLQSSNVLAMAFNNANSGVTMASASNARFGAVGFGLGLSSTDTDNFTLALKTLWETCTGQTLP
jgi:hypothetical protein